MALQQSHNLSSIPSEVFPNEVLHISRINGSKQNPVGIYIHQTHIPNIIALAKTIRRKKKRIVLRALTSNPKKISKKMSCVELACYSVTMWCLTRPLDIMQNH